MLIQRPDYLNFLMEWKDQPIIKVISGIRRCGKSTLFDLFQDQLRAEGVREEQIICLNFEEAENEDLCDYRALYDHVKSRMLPDKMNYIFLDEIQHVTDYQKAVDSLFVKKNECVSHRLQCLLHVRGAGNAAVRAVCGAENAPPFLQGICQCL